MDKVESKVMDNARFLRIFGDLHRVTFDPKKDGIVAPALVCGYFPVRDFEALKQEIQEARGVK